MDTLGTLIKQANKEKELKHLKRLLSNYRKQLNDYNYFLIVNSKNQNSVGVETSNFPKKSKDIIRKHKELHDKWAKKQGYSGIS